MQHTPHAWPFHTLQNFPPVLVDMVSETTGPKENVAQLKKSVEEEWRLVFFRQDRIICYLTRVKINTYSCAGHGAPWTTRTTSSSTSPCLRSVEINILSSNHELLLLKGNNNLFLCLLWKMILETDDISPIAYKVCIDDAFKDVTEVVMEGIGEDWSSWLRIFDPSVTSWFMSSASLVGVGMSTSDLGLPCVPVSRTHCHKAKFILRLLIIMAQI